MRGREWGEANFVVTFACGGGESHATAAARFHAVFRPRELAGRGVRGRDDAISRACRGQLVMARRWQVFCGASASGSNGDSRSSFFFSLMVVVGFELLVLIEGILWFW